MTDVPNLFDSAPFVWCSSRELPSDECAQLRERCLSLLGPDGTGSGAFQGRGRVQFEDPDLLLRLEQLVAPSLPKHMGAFALVGLNPMLRFYVYRPGQSFPPHVDYWYQVSPHDITLVTVLLYLNDDFEGGATAFDPSPGGPLNFGTRLTRVVLPKTGRMALWQHQVLHEGCEVTKGMKYVLRTDAVYRAPSPIGLIGGLSRSRFR